MRGPVSGSAIVGFFLLSAACAVIGVGVFADGSWGFALGFCGWAGYFFFWMARIVVWRIRNIGWIQAGTVLFWMASTLPTGALVLNPRTSDLFQRIVDKDSGLTALVRVLGEDVAELSTLDESNTGINQCRSETLIFGSDGIYRHLAMATLSVHEGAVSVLSVDDMPETGRRLPWTKSRNGERVGRAVLLSTALLLVGGVVVRLPEDA